MKRDNLYLSTIAEDAPSTAREFGLGLEIAEFCTAWNMDEEFGAVDPVVRQRISGIGNRVLHAPYNELFPCAIDRKVRALAAERYRQAIGLAKVYGADKVIIHGGYNPWLYYHPWYLEQSMVFWREFMQQDPGVELVLENVLEETPDLLLAIVEGVNHPRLKLCLDVGHVNAYSKIPVETWLERWAPHLSHFHIHNNHGDRDAHLPLDQGSISMSDFLRSAQVLCPEASYTLELMETKPSIQFLLEEGIL